MLIKNISLISILFLFCNSVQAQISFDSDIPAPGNLKFSWIHGSQSAQANQDARIQVHRYNEHTYILRQNPAVHWEAPFMYLVIGNERAVLLDTGATEEPEYFPLRQVIDKLLARWSYAQGTSMPELVVLPLGSEQSQVAAVNQFTGRSNTLVIPPDEESRRQVLGSNWLQGGKLDLGGRVLDALPTPGLDTAAISLYDPWSDLLFTGNTFYPGRLVIRDFKAYRDSLESLRSLVGSMPVSMILGGRIEMTDRPGLDYRLRSNYRPDERILQLYPEHLVSASLAVNLINGSKDIRILNDFIIMNGVGRGARDYGYPVFIPERFRNVNTR